MNLRDEEILRELKLYPLWVRRDLPVEASRMGGGAADTHQESPAVAELVSGAVEAQQTAMGIASLNPSCSWLELKQKVRDCTACQLRAGCTQTVFGVGDEKAEWLFVGEGPGADEDARGEPFVGQAGKLLDNMLAAIKLKRGANVYIANIVKCRPPDNRNPEADEIAACLPYLQQQIALIKPKLIVALGKVAATSLLGRDATLGSLRGTVHDFHGTPLIVTYHPAYLLRSPAEKAKAWQDLCFAVQQMK
ncbi:MAG: uracil-DNA glycosylase [Sideroxydans sp.]|nr:uracil-DNA glycosylase [Sideroxydans sp.]